MQSLTSPRMDPTTDNNHEKATQTETVEVEKLRIKLLHQFQRKLQCHPTRAEIIHQRKKTNKKVKFRAKLYREAAESQIDFRISGRDSSRCSGNDVDFASNFSILYDSVQEESGNFETRDSLCGWQQQ